MPTVAITRTLKTAVLFTGGQVSKADAAISPASLAFTFPSKRDGKTGYVFGTSASKVAVVTAMHEETVAVSKKLCPANSPITTKGQERVAPAVETKLVLKRQAGSGTSGSASAVPSAPPAKVIIGSTSPFPPKEAVRPAL